MTNQIKKISLYTSLAEAYLGIMSCIIDDLPVTSAAVKQVMCDESDWQSHVCYIQQLCVIAVIKHSPWDIFPWTFSGLDNVTPQVRHFPAAVKAKI